MNKRDEQCDEDLELLRQVALTSLLKKKSDTTTNAVFYRPSANSNLISIQPVAPESVSKLSDASARDTDSENEIIIAEGLSVTSEDCDEIVEEYIVTDDDDDDEINNNNEGASDGEDAVSVASKDSFDEILNSIEEEINGGIKKKSTPGTAKFDPIPKKRKESLSSKNGQKVEEKKAIAKPESLRRRSRSPCYRRSPENRRQHESFANRRDKYGSSRRELRRSRSRSLHRRRSRSGSKNSHSPFRVETRRPRSPLTYSERRWQTNKSRHRSNSKPDNKSPTYERRHRSRSPFEPVPYKGSIASEKPRSPPRHHRNRGDGNKQAPRPELSRKSISPKSLQHRRLNESEDNTSKRRSTSPSRRKREYNHNPRSPPVAHHSNKEDKYKSSKKLRQTDKRSPTPPPESRRNLSTKEREVFEKRKLKFDSRNISKASASGKVVLKPSSDDRSKEARRGFNVKKVRMTEDDNIISEVPNDERNHISKARYERKLKLSSRLGVKVRDDEEITETGAEQPAIEPVTTEYDKSPEDQTHSQESSPKISTDSNTCSNTSPTDDSLKVELNREDLRSKLEQKRASGGGRLFTAALKNIDDTGSGSEKKSKRKLISMTP